MKAIINRRESLRAIGALAGATALGEAFSQTDSGQLVVPSPGGRYERFWRETILPPFERKTGIKTTLDVGVAMSWAAKLRATGANKPVSSFTMMNEVVGAMLRSEGYFTAWPVAKVPNIANLPKNVRLDNDFGITAMVSPIGIAYRTDLVKTPPRAWKDLWTSRELKGKIGLFSGSTTVSFTMLMMMGRVFGSGPLDFDVAFRKLEELKPFPQADLAGALAMLLTRNEIVACPLDFSETLSMKKKGVPVEFVAPEEGMFCFDQTFSLLKQSANPDGACAFLNHMLSEEIQGKLVAEFGAIAVNPKVKIPPEVAREVPFTTADLDKFITFPWVEASKQRDMLSERWQKVTR